MSKPSSTIKTVKTDPRVTVLVSEYNRLHETRQDAPSAAAQAAVTRTLQKLWDAIAKIDSDALASLPPIKAPKSAALISDDAAAILASLSE